MTVQEMRRYLNIVFFFALSIVLMGCAEKGSSLERLSIDFPNGESRLLVQRDGQAFLFYGALPQRQIVKKGTFDIDSLYEQLRERLHDNVPRENWPNPKSTFGMVQITFRGGKPKEYLIFDEEEFAAQLFDKVRKNIVDQKPTGF